MDAKLRVTTTTDVNNSLIFQRIEHADERDYVQLLKEWVYDAADKQLHEALIKLGWTPPPVGNSDKLKGVE